MKTANLNVRIDRELKKEAESVLATLGISTSAAINLFFKQIVLNKGIPFEVKVPYGMNAELMTPEELENEISAGVGECERGEGKEARRFFDEFDKKHGLWSYTF